MQQKHVQLRMVHIRVELLRPLAAGWVPLFRLLEVRARANPPQLHSAQRNTS